MTTENGNTCSMMSQVEPPFLTVTSKSAENLTAKGKVGATWMCGHGIQNCGVHTVPRNGMWTHTCTGGMQICGRILPRSKSKLTPTDPETLTSCRRMTCTGVSTSSTVPPDAATETE